MKKHRRAFIPFLVAGVVVMGVTSAPISAKADSEEGISLSAEVDVVLGRAFDATLKYPEVYANSTAISENHIAIVLKEGSRDGEAFRDYVARAVPKGVTVDWSTDSYSQEDIVKMADAARSVLTERGLAFSGGYYDPDNGTFVARTPEPVSAKTILPDISVGPEVFPLRVEQGVTSSEARYTDGGQWEGGLALNNSSAAPSVGAAHCTGGFTWKKWGTGTLYGSTAEHCAHRDRNGDGDDTDANELVTTRFFNNGNAVGDRQFTCPGFTRQCDTMLLKQVNPANTWGNTVWWGAENTVNLRYVTFTTLRTVGSVVWNSGANTGTKSTTVRSLTAVNEWGGNAVELNAWVTRGGDSGSPWGVPTGTNTLSAVGQHYGRVCTATNSAGVCTASRSLYTPLNSISPALTASVYIGS